VEGERLNAKLELSRTYLGVAGRLFEKKSRHDTLNGKSLIFLPQLKNFEPVDVNKLFERNYRAGISKCGD
jgi:hypothetical protein